MLEDLRVFDPRAVETTEGRLQSDCALKTYSIWMAGISTKEWGDKKNGQAYTVKSWQERKSAWPGRKWRKEWRFHRRIYTVKAEVEGREMSSGFSPQSIHAPQLPPGTNVMCRNVFRWHSGLWVWSRVVHRRIQAVDILPVGIRNLF